MSKRFTSSFHKGVDLNSSPSALPKDKARFIYNGVVSDENLDELYVKREKGNRLCVHIPGDWKEYGHCYTTDNRVVVFLGNGTSSHISLIDGDCNYQILVDEECLNLTNWVDATYRVRRGCEDIVYFTDFYNPVRSIDISNINQYIKNGSFDCSLLDLLRPFLVPCFARIDVVRSGGSVRYGSYNATVQYLDENLNVTNSIYSSSVVTVSDSDKGGFNVDSNPEIGKISNRSIRFNLTGLDTKFPYYRLIIVEASAGTGFPSKYLVLNHQPTTNGTVIFDGNPSNYTVTSRDEVINQSPVFDRARYIDQVENKLVLAHIAGPAYNYCEWQKFASKICAEYVVEEIDELEYLAKGMAGNWAKTFMGDEVYAAGIVYVDNKGRHHPEFHVPGVGLNSNCACDFEDINCIDQTIQLSYNIIFNPTKKASWDILITFTYSVNGKVFTEEKRISGFSQPGDKTFNETFDVKLICFGDDFKKIDLKWEHLTPPVNILDVSLSYSLTTPGTATTNGANLAPLLGWDDTVYPTWHSDMAHIISLPQMMSIIDTYNKTAKVKVIYNDYSLKNLKELKKVPGLPRRWQIYNTAYKGGRLAYWECSNSVYENPHGCIEDYWGKDSCGNKLEGTPIRHIKFPDRTLEPVVTSQVFKQGEVDTKPSKKVRRLGLKFKNIEYPHPDIVGHYFVFGERDSFNRTIIDKGIMNPTRRASLKHNEKIFEGFSYHSELKISDNNWYSSPKMLLTEESISGTHVKLENEYTSIEEPISSTEWVIDPGFFTDQKLLIDVLIFYQIGTKNPLAVNIPIVDSYSLDSLTTIEKQDRIVTNMALTTKVGFVQTEGLIPKSHDPLEGFCFVGHGYDRISIPYKLIYAAIKNNVDVHCNLDNIIYYRGHDCMLSGSESTVYGGDVFITPFDFNYVLLRETYNFFKNGSFDPVFSYYLSQGLTTELVINDCFDSLRSELDFIEFSGELMMVWVESEVCYNLRSSGITPETTTLFPARPVYHFNAGDSMTRLVNHFKSKIAVEEVKDGTVVQTPRVKPLLEFYLYNFDYSRNNHESIYIGLPRSYDCCSNCIEYFPNRIYYSETSFTEELSDNFKTFKANNFKDIPADKGPITDILRDNNTLIVHTTSGLWSFPYGYQEVPRNDIVSFIGDGAFMSLPPKLHVDSETGNAGSLNRQSTVKTPYGIFFIDEASAIPYLFTGKLTQLKLDLEGFFNLHLNSYMRNEVKKISNDSVDTLIYNLATYDELNERVIFTKLDYSFRLNVDDYEFKNNKFYHGNKEVSLKDETYFISRCFTCSYSFKKNAWFFHSYLPEYYIHNKGTFISFFESAFWSHDSLLYNNYFGKQYPFIVEIDCGQDEQTKAFHSLSLSVVSKNKTPKGWIETLDFFDQVIIYNESQSTGLLDLVKDTFGYSGNNIRVVRRDEDWNINQFRDMVVSDEPIFLEDRSLLPVDYYIDKLPNPACTSIRKDWDKRNIFKDKYLLVRFILNSKPETQFIVKTLGFDVNSL